MPTDRQSIGIALRTIFDDGDRIMLGILRQNNGEGRTQHAFFGIRMCATAENSGRDGGSR